MRDSVGGLRPAEKVDGQAAPTVLALVELTGDDAPVVAAARVLVGRNPGTVVLLHVATPVRRRGRGWWRRMEAVDAAARAGLNRWAAAPLRRRGVYVQTAVRFGDPVDQLVKAAVGVNATVVVAASRPAGWLWWRGRDRRLRRSLDIPVYLVAAAQRETTECPAPDASGSRSAA